MLRQVVVKVNRACNLRCRYCYYINDRTVNLGAKLSMSVLCAFLDKYTEYCRRNGITGNIAFHGGEPLLEGRDFFRHALSHEGFRLGVIRAAVQTNGVLVDQRWVKLFAEQDVHVGISLDGPKSINDRQRVFRNGSGSYDLVLRGLRLLKEAGRNPTVLCVVDPEANGADVLNHLVDIGAERIDFLPPISNHAIQNRNPFDLAGTAQFLVDAFIAWTGLGNSQIEVRLFMELIQRFMHGRGGYPPIGMDYWSHFAILEVDGEIARLEELADTEWVDGRTRYLTGCNILHESIDSAIEALQLRHAHIDHLALPRKCERCDMRDVCNGGSIASRCDSHGSFDNPGVHCAALYRLSALVKQFCSRLNFCDESGLAKSALLGA